MRDHREQTSIFMKSTNFAHFRETPGHCKNSDEYVMAQENRKKKKGMLTGVFHIEK